LGLERISLTTLSGFRDLESVRSTDIQMLAGNMLCVPYLKIGDIHGDRFLPHDVSYMQMAGEPKVEVMVKNTALPMWILVREMCIALVEQLLSTSTNHVKAKDETQLIDVLMQKKHSGFQYKAFVANGLRLMEAIRDTHDLDSELTMLGAVPADRMQGYPADGIAAAYRSSIIDEFYEAASTAYNEACNISRSMKSDVENHTKEYIESTVEQYADKCQLLRKLPNLMKTTGYLPGELLSVMRNRIVDFDEKAAFDEFEKKVEQEVRSYKINLDNASKEADRKVPAARAEYAEKIKETFDESNVSAV